MLTKFASITSRLAAVAARETAAGWNKNILQYIRWKERLNSLWKSEKKKCFKLQTNIIIKFQIENLFVPTAVAAGFAQLFCSCYFIIFVFKVAFSYISVCLYR
jgi:hypothetical protein